MYYSEMRVPTASHFLKEETTNQHRICLFIELVEDSFRQPTKSIPASKPLVPAKNM